MSVHRIKAFADVGPRPFAWLVFLTCIALLNGCASFASKHSKPPVTVSEVIQMSKDRLPAETIIEKMRDSESVYRLTASQLAHLHDEGVSDQVIDYMQQTYVSAVRQDQRLEDWDYWTLGPDGFWYGGPYYGWPYGWIVVERRGDQHWGGSGVGERHQSESAAEVGHPAAAAVGERGGRK